MHRYTDQTEELAKAILSYTTRRLRMDPVPLDGPKSSAELADLAGQTITAEGIGGAAALRIFARGARAGLHLGRPPALPVVHPGRAHRGGRCCSTWSCGASSIYGGSWLEGAGAVYAENQALRWIADLVGLPAGAGGVFVPGGTNGNLSAPGGGARTPPPTRRAAGRSAARGRRGDGERALVDRTSAAT